MALLESITVCRTSRSPDAQYHRPSTLSQFSFDANTVVQAFGVECEDLGSNPAGVLLFRGHYERKTSGHTKIFQHKNACFIQIMCFICAQADVLLAVIWLVT